MLEELGIYPTFKILIFYGIIDWLKRQKKSPISAAKGYADPEKEKIIFTMLYQNNFVQFKNALVRHPDSVFWTAEGGNTLLHIAVMLQRHRYIGSLLAFGADIFQSNGEEESSFTLAKTAFFLQRSTASSAEKEVDNRRENIIGNFLQLAPNLQ